MSASSPIPPVSTVAEPSPPSRVLPAGVHRFAVVLAGLVVLLIAAGALVKSKEAGLSVPDWPLSYGGFNPPHWWRIETVRAEHGHRMFAGTIALLTVLLAVLLERREPRSWVRKLGWSAVGAVFAQALLGGLTVLFFLPPAISIAHAGLAELFLCLVTSIAIVTSPTWSGPAQPSSTPGVQAVAPLALATTVAIYVQILLGAVMRHNGAGLAIPDFPLAFGRLVPDHFDFKIGIHYAHRLGALTVAILILTTAARVLARFRSVRLLVVPTYAMLGLVVVQITLGALVVLTRKAVLPNTVHVATGAALLATSLALTLRTRRLVHTASPADAADAANAADRAARAASGSPLSTPSREVAS